MFSSLRVNMLISSPLRCTCSLIPSYLVSQSAHPISGMISSRGGASCASIGFTGVPGVRLSFSKPALPCSLAVLATTEKSLVSIWALSTIALSMSNASAIASRTIPSPTPILSSSVIVRVRYFASVALACDSSSRRTAILRFVDLEPEICDSLRRLLKTKSIVRGCEKNVTWDFLAYSLMQARPMSPSSRTASSTAACVVPTASATALSTSFPPIPISSELHAGKTVPKMSSPTFSMVSESRVFR